MDNESGPAAAAVGSVGAEERENPAFVWAYNLFYWPYLLSTVVLLFAPAVALFVLTFWWDDRRRWMHAYTCLWGGHYLAWAPFAGVTVLNREHGEVGPCIYVCNHQSMVDILAVFATRFPFLWVSKIENFYVPFLGWNMWLNRYVGLKRGYLPSIMRMVRTCHRRLASGHSLFIFPEGTRSPDGNLIEFYAGAFRLAVRNNVPIVPIVLQGTREILPKHSFRIRPRRVFASVLPPMHPAAHANDHKALKAAVRAVMAAEIDRLRGA